MVPDSPITGSGVADRRPRSAACGWSSVYSTGSLFTNISGSVTRESGLVPPIRPRTTADPDAFAAAIFSGRPFVGAAALAAGVLSEHELRTQFRRVLPGIHLSTGFDYDASARVRAAWLWAPPGAVIAGSAAALLHGEWQVAAEEVHRAVDLYLPRTVRAPRGIRIHALRQPLRAQELAVLDSIPFTAVGRTALDLARWHRDPLRAAIAVDAVCNVTQTPVPGVEEYARTTERLHGRRRALKLFERCDHRADSPRETRLRLIIKDSPLPDPEPQVTILDSAGSHIATADLAYRANRVALFYDGESHLDREQRDWDSSVTARLFDEGWLDLRITSGMMNDPATLVRRVWEMLRRQASRAA